ncbi:Bacterial extracellular solute-binding protein [Caprobacter fermentans]|uniref:Bacterial extracellular solute-binding protein n=1 Tax=Caproicibacter fermentans TaxID=2576756 RepID=A0A6N8HXX8_9FIRM|nr:ABC transporter substrate-binding protein [Caproicibacter fermentans]MVB10327.1 Bacterial extracellular solute-binding protein [Caproicibacter fermentans]
MRKIISALLCAAMMVSAAACSSGTADTVGSSGQGSEDPSGASPTKITFWYAWTDKIQENNVNLAKQFNETVGKEKGIEVDAQYQGSYDDVHQKLQAAYVSGSTPAVSVMEISSIKRFAQNGVIEPLSPYIQQDGVDMNDFYQGLLQNCKVGDAWYGLPYLRSTPILYMNTTLLEKAGLDPSGPKTWEELADYCKTIKEKTGAYGLSMYSYIWTLEAFFLENGTSVLNKDESATNLNTDQGKYVLKYFRDLIDKGDVRCVAGADSSKVDADYMNQKCAMWFASTANLSKALSVAKQNHFEVNICYIPKNVQYGVPTGGCNLVMTTKISEKEKKAAWEFIKWMTDTEQSAYASKYTGYVTSRKSATKTSTIQDLYKTTPQFKVALDQLNDCSVGRPMNPGYTEASKELVNVMDAVWVNGADIDSTVAKEETKINQCLK